MNLYPILKPLEGLIKKLLQATGWEMKPGKHFGETDPYRCYMHREGDQTIAENAKMKTKVEKYRGEREDHCPVEYKAARDWLDSHSQMQNVNKKDKIDPHELDLYKLKAKSADGEHVSAYDFINYFLEASNKYIANHPQQGLRGHISYAATQVSNEALGKEEHAEMLSTLNSVVQVVSAQDRMFDVSEGRAELRAHSTLRDSSENNLSLSR